MSFTRLKRLKVEGKRKRRTGLWFVYDHCGQMYRPKMIGGRYAIVRDFNLSARQRYQYVRGVINK